MNVKFFVQTLKKRLSSPGGVVSFFLLGAWSIFQYIRGNELYAAYIVLLYLILLMPRPQNFALVAVSVLVIVLFKTPVLDAWIEIRDTNLRAFQSFKPSISRLFTPDSGREVLPSEVQQMLSLLQENKITGYRLANSIEQDPLISQRIVESAWPMKKEAASPYILYPIEEIADLTGCVEVAKGKDIALVRCP